MMQIFTERFQRLLENIDEQNPEFGWVYLYNLALDSLIQRFERFLEQNSEPRRIINTLICYILVHLFLNLIGLTFHQSPLFTLLVGLLFGSLISFNAAFTQRTEADAAAKLRFDSLRDRANGVTNRLNTLHRSIEKNREYIDESLARQTLSITNEVNTQVHRSYLQTYLSICVEHGSTLNTIVTTLVTIGVYTLVNKFYS